MKIPKIHTRNNLYTRHWKKNRAIGHKCTPGGGRALEYESDGYVPTGEQKQWTFGVVFR